MIRITSVGHQVTFINDKKFMIWYLYKQMVRFRVPENRYDVVTGYDNLHRARAQFYAQFDSLVGTTEDYLLIIVYKVADNYYLLSHDNKVISPHCSRPLI